MKGFLKLSLLSFGVVCVFAAEGFAQVPCTNCYGGYGYGGHVHSSPALPAPTVYDTWHGAYSHPGYGHPVALVVPPISQRQGDYSWGVPSTHTSPIYPQFGPYGGGGMVGGAGYGGFMPAPVWPSHTNQMGVYYVRGPWD
ncbi:Hypothetical protein PBC10988_20760 [Planctomycetales bacterium 10988]|nr:Hypothetical protein PBC10988_20760 [Planctomycetales bacterium 10988]